MSLPTALPDFQAGFRLPDGSDLEALRNWLCSVQTGLVALAGGAQASATRITAAIAKIATVASGNDSVQLPAAKAGMRVTVINGGANTARVYGREGTVDTINGTIGTTPVTQATLITATYVCPHDGEWWRELSA